MTNKSWLASYLYYSEPWDSFLVNAVKPFAEDVLKKGLAENYFFIRYWEKGPHIRLRFYGDTAPMEQALKKEIQVFFDDYFAKAASHRVDPEWLDQLPEDQRWFPNNSVQFIPYEPETERYGGEQALSIGERQFRSSSDAVLQAISDTGDWSYERALGVAIQLHLAFAHAMGMDSVEALEFYSYVFSGWLPMAYNSYQIPEEERKQRQEETLEAFQENFTKQKDFLVNYHQVLWEAFADNEEFEQEWLNRWISDLRQVHQSLMELKKENKIQYPGQSFRDDTFKTPAERQSMWNIYSSYVHMTNNRLGIQNRDEGFLGYLIRESLKYI